MDVRQYAQQEMSENQVIAELQRHIDDYVKRYECYGIDGHGIRLPFVPEVALTNFWTIEKITAALGHGEDLVLHRPEVIMEHYIVVFSILVLTSKAASLYLFTQLELSDKSLPLDSTPKSYRGSLYNDVFESFMDLQWKFCPMSLYLPLGPKPSRRTLAPAVILPILGKERINPKANEEIDTAVLYKAELHRLSIQQTVPVVFKEYRKDSQESWRLFDNEWVMYSHLREDSFDHIVRYYGSFSCLDRRTIVLEHAPGGDLISFFKSRLIPNTDWHRTQLWQNLFGLLEGLIAIDDVTRHDLHSRDTWHFRGTHQDIRPQNILICGYASDDDYSVPFKFSDLGTAHIRKVVNNGIDRPAVGLFGNGMYSAPEAYRDNEFAIGIGHKSDVYSLGGILSETLIWSIWGERGREAYQAERVEATREFRWNRGFHEGAFHDGDGLLHVVEKWHDRAIALTDGKAEALSQLIIKSMLAHDPDRRETAVQVFQKFKDVIGTLASNNEPHNFMFKRRIGWPVSPLSLAVQPQTIPTGSMGADQSPTSISRSSQISSMQTNELPIASLPALDFPEIQFGHAIHPVNHSLEFKLPGSKVPTADSLGDSGYSSGPKPHTPAKVLDQENDENDDNGTICTDWDSEISISAEEKKTYTSLFVDNLRSDVLSHTGMPCLNSEVETSLRPLLRTFALKLRATESSIPAKELSAFVRVYRNHIATEFQIARQIQVSENGNSERSGVIEAFRNRDKVPSVEEKMKIWARANSSQVEDSPLIEFLHPESLESLAPLDTEGSDGLSDGVSQEDVELLAETSKSRFLKYQNMLLRTHAYEWLLSAIGKRARLNLRHATAITAIQEAVSLALKAHRRDKTDSSCQYALFDVDWDPHLFMEQQDYPDHESLGLAITISGSARYSQLLSCRQYLRQCWPNLGESVLDGIMAALPKDYGSTIKLQLFDNTKLLFSVFNSRMVVQCQGTEDSIIEVAEIAAWVGSSMREATSKDKITYVTPRVSETGTTIRGIQHGSQTRTVRFSIEFQEEHVLYKEAQASNGFCWRGLFGNPVIAKGFPILLREDTPGLEIPLSLMAHLVDAKRTTLFHGQTFLKGFNAAAVPTNISSNILSWHLILNESRYRLSYDDARISEWKNSCPSELLIELSGMRHVLGWVSQASHNVGSPGANYDDLWTSPDYVSSGCVLEKFMVQMGVEFLTVGAEFAVGKKDPSPLIMRGEQSYIESLDPLLRDYVVLYDCKDRRAWLANGVSALLHLVRASLRYDLQGAFKSEYVFKESDIEESANASGPDAARDVLCNRKNWYLPIQHNDSPGTQRCFIDRVNQVRVVLEQLIAHQQTVSSPGMALTLAPRGQLEGYRFMDIATRKRPIPSVVDLQIYRQSGNSWVDFTRALGAVTLFGDGFGDLIAPSPGSTGICPRWRYLPCDKDFLAVSTYDLSMILRYRGNRRSHPLKLVPGVFWHRAGELFEDCACSTGSSTQPRFGIGLQRSCDRAQVLLSSTSLKIIKRTTAPGPLNDGGAVIFGRSSRFPWKWPDKGDIESDPIVGEEEQNIADYADDTAISGSSMMPPSSSHPTTAGSAQDSSRTDPTTVTLEEHRIETPNSDQPISGESHKPRIALHQRIRHSWQNNVSNWGQARNS